MTDDEYYARVRALGLKPSKIPTVYQTLDEQMLYNVPLPSSLNDDEKLSLIEALTHMLRD